MEDFIKWLEKELQRRGWSVPELARRSARGGHEGISSSMVYKVLNGHARPGTRFIEGMARALDTSREELYRRAGLLPPAPSPDRPDLKRALYLLSKLPPSERELIIDLMETMIARHGEKELAPATS